MSTGPHRSDPSVVRTLLYALGATVAFPLAFVAAWRFVGRGPHLQVIYGTYVFLAVVAVGLLGRVLDSRDWLHALGAIALLVGLAVTVYAGLQPKPDCLDFGPCPQRGITPHPRWLVAGGLLTACGLVLDLRRSV